MSCTALGCLELACALQVFSSNPVISDNQKCVQRLPNFHWGTRSALIASHWRRKIMPLNLMTQALHETKQPSPTSYNVATITCKHFQTVPVLVFPLAMLSV